MRALKKCIARSSNFRDLSTGIFNTEPFTFAKTWRKKILLWYQWKFIGTHLVHTTFGRKECFNRKELSAATAAKSLQSCLTLCDPIDGSPSGSPVPGILQARTLEWVAISFSNEWKWKVKVESLSHVCLLVTPRAAAYQAAPSMGFSRQEYWSGVPLPSSEPSAGGSFLSYNTLAKVHCN